MTREIVMKPFSKCFAGLWFLVGLFFIIGFPISATAQVNTRDIPLTAQPQQRFNIGQDLQPIYEGWVRNEDGTFTFHMGYLNRNYEEQPYVPVGPNNFLSPGPPDQGQPTYFYPRTQRYQFSVTVPADWGPTKELVWQLTHNGSTQYLYAWLQPEWEIDRKNITSILNLQRGRSNDVLYADSPSVVTIDPVQPVTLPNTLTLTARVADDGLPEDLPERQPRRLDPTLQRPDGAPDIPDNIITYSKPMPPRNGLAVQWILYRGPAEVTFDSDEYDAWEQGDEGDGKTAAVFSTTATFTDPGSYVLRAVVSAGMLLTPADIEVTVTGAN